MDNSKVILTSYFDIDSRIGKDLEEGRNRLKTLRYIYRPMEREELNLESRQRWDYETVESDLEWNLC